jgi:hypothetical protein
MDPALTKETRMDGEWRDKIEGTLGVADRRFARHSNDQERAFDLLKQLRVEGVGMSEVEEAYRELLADHTPAAFSDEMRRVAEHFRPWLRD